MMTSVRHIISDVKAATSGMQDIDVYLKYYACAKEAPIGHIIDVGTGQGGSTISFALGLKDNSSKGDRSVYALDQFHQHKTGPHPFSLSEYPDNCVQMNIESFEANLRRFEVDKYVKTVPGKIVEFPEAICKDADIGILCLDNDGYIDRDLQIFYDRVAPGGWIIVDDCQNAINKNGRKILDKIEGKSIGEIRSFVAARRDKLNGGGRILGKHLLTYRLMQYLIRAGAIELVETLKGTAFGHKCTSRPFAQVVDPSEFERVKADIQAEFVELATSTTCQ